MSHPEIQTFTTVCHWLRGAAAVQVLTCTAEPDDLQEFQRHAAQ